MARKRKVGLYGEVLKGLSSFKADYVSTSKEIFKQKEKQIKAQFKAGEFSAADRDRRIGLAKGALIKANDNWQELVFTQLNIPMDGSVKYDLRTLAKLMAAEGSEKASLNLRAIGSYQPSVLFGSAGKIRNRDMNFVSGIKKGLLNRGKWASYDNMTNKELGMTLSEFLETGASLGLYSDADYQEAVSDLGWFKGLIKDVKDMLSKNAGLAVAINKGLNQRHKDLDAMANFEAIMEFMD